MSFYVVLTALLVSSAHTQDIPTIELCSEDNISTSLQFGRIIHTQGTGGLPRYCTIAFTNVTSGGYTVLTRPSNDSVRYGCRSDFLNVSSGFDSYCAGDEETIVLRQNLSVSELNISSTTASFTVDFYNSGKN